MLYFDFFFVWSMSYMLIWKGQGSWLILQPANRGQSKSLYAVYGVKWSHKQHIKQIKCLHISSQNSFKPTCPPHAIIRGHGFICSQVVWDICWYCTKRCVLVCFHTIPKVITLIPHPWLPRWWNTLCLRKLVVIKQNNCVTKSKWPLVYY